MDFELDWKFGFCNLEFMNIVGHQKITNFLNKSIEKGVVSHAYLFSGPEHLGKFGIALDFARKLTGSKAEIDPDLIIIKPETIKNSRGIIKEEEIKIEKIREIQKVLSTTACFGRHKVGIIDNADKLNKAAQNAMLKILEEPSENAVIILIARDISKILPTIKSRCIIKKFSLVPDENIRRMIPSEVKNRENMVFWSLGRPGLVKKFLENKDELEKKGQTEKALVDLLGSNVSEKMAFAEKASKDTPELIEILECWMVVLRKFLLAELAEDVSIPSEKILRIVEKIKESIESIRSTNSNARLVLENLLLEI